MYERMLDKNNKPTAEELARHCGENGGRFQSLNSELSERFHTAQEIRFPYGNNYGWCTTHRKAKKLICDIFAESGAFTVMLRLSGTQYDAVYAQLQPYTQRVIDNRYPCGDGGWIHYRVLNEENLKDVMLLLGEKCK